MGDVKKNRNVTVYDICMYRSCNHGRYTTGHHLYRFPDGRKNPELMREWVSRSGNKIRLRHWTASSIRNAGLCPDHFEANMFQENRRLAPNAVRKLKKHAVPIKFEKPKEIQKICPIAIDPSAIAQLLNDENLRISSREEEKCASFSEQAIDKPERGNKVHLLRVRVEKATKDKGKQKNTVLPKMSNTVEAENNENVENVENVENLDNLENAENSEHLENAENSEHLENEITEPCINEPTEIEQLKVHERGKLTLSNSDDDIELDQLNTVSESLQVTMLKRENESLRNDLKFVKEKYSSLQQQLQRARMSRDNYRSAVQYYKHESIDDFLNRRNCTNPVARAMIKLQLHKSKVEYTPDEKELVKDIFYHSISAFKYLRKSGCKMPGESTVKRWIQESDDIYDSSNYILPDEEEEEEYIKTEELIFEEELDENEEKT